MTTPVRELAFIDTSITDWETLLAGLSPDLEVVILDPARDGLLQIADTLRNRSDISAIHLFSHGSSGELILGGMVLNAGNLVDYGDALVTIGNALTATGDILLYGCNVAQGEAGQAFIAQLAAGTGADVAASDDLTGNQAAGGDWALEKSTGTIDAEALQPATYAGTLSPSDPVIDIFNSVGFYATFAELSKAAYHLSGYPLSPDESTGHGDNFIKPYADESWNQINATWRVLSAGELVSPSTGTTTVLDIGFNEQNQPWEIHADGIYTCRNAAAFAVRCDDAVIISFRGTNDNDDGVWPETPDESDWVDMGEHYSELRPFIQIVDDYITAQDITKVYVTGHSLGGGMALAYMGEHPDHVESGTAISYEAVTFAAPGYYFLKAFDPRILSIEITGDPVPDVPKGYQGYTINVITVGPEGYSGTDWHSMDMYLAAAKAMDQELPDTTIRTTDGSGATIHGLMQSMFGPLNALDVTMAMREEWATADSHFWNGPLAPRFVAMDGDNQLQGFADIGGVPSGALVTGPYLATKIQKAGVLIGGDGNDVYLVDHVDDQVVESPDSGIDTVNAHVSYTLGANVENLKLFTNNKINGTGNNQGNWIEGNDAANILNGLGGGDTLWGKDGDDTLDGGDGNDMLGGGVGDDRLVGGTGDDIYRYWLHDDDERIFDAGGNDQLWLDSISLADIDGVSRPDGSNDLVIEIDDHPWLPLAYDKITIEGWYAGSDNQIETVRIDDMDLSGAAFINLVEQIEAGGAGLRPAGDSSDQLYYGTDAAESIDLQGGNDRGYGRGGDDTIIGGDGNDWLEGGMGADKLKGGTGDDTYVVDDAGDVVDEAMPLGVTLNDIPIIVSSNVLGQQGSGFSVCPNFSVDGRYVSFTSNALDLAAGDQNSIKDVFVKDLLSGAVQVVSISAAGVQGDDASGDVDFGGSKFSADGHYVSFTSYAHNLVDGGTNYTKDVFVKNLQSGAVQQASINAAGGQGNGHSEHADISADGRYVVFESYASNLVAGDTNSYVDIFIKNLESGSLLRVSTSAAGGQGNGGSVSADISADGRYVLFESDASNLVAGDVNGKGDVFVKDLQSGTIQLVSTSTTGEQGKWDSGNAHFSADGRYVVFTSYANLIAPSDNTYSPQIFIKDLQTGAIQCVSTNAAGTKSNGWNFSASLSTDGRYVVFESTATNLVPDDYFYSSTYQIFVKDLHSGAIQCVSVSGSNTLGNMSSNNAQFSPDGRYILFETNASNLIPGGDLSYGEDVIILNNPFSADGGGAPSAGGTDTIRASIAYMLPAGLENLILTGSDPLAGTGNAAANQLTGNSAANVLDSGAGNDTLVGLGGNDFLLGGAGDDTYQVNLVRAAGSGLAALEDSIREGINQGNDRVILETADHVTLTTPLTTLTLGTNLETLDAALTGATKLDLTGNALDNTLIGNAAANVLDGGAGTDHFVGGLGDDTYVIDRTGELSQVTENAGEGSDTLKIAYTNTQSAAETITLGGTLAAIENATIVESNGFGTSPVNTQGWGGAFPKTTSTGLFNLTGNGLDNILTGNNSTNVLAGGAGNDILYGQGGGDTLNGGDGNDLLQGDTGGDLLTGGAGNDRFVFTSKLAGDADRITDFTEGDQLVFQGSLFKELGGAGALNAAAFGAGPVATTAVQHLLYDAAQGYLYYDADGSGVGAKVLVANLTNHAVLDAGDFWVA